MDYFRIYINFLDGGVHAGAYVDGYLYYHRTVDMGESHLLRGYLDVRLHPNAPRNWTTVRQVINEAFSELRAPEPTTIHEIVTPTGRLDILYRPGVPNTPDAVFDEVRHVYAYLHKHRGAPAISE